MDRMLKLVFAFFLLLPLTACQKDCPPGEQAAGAAVAPVEAIEWKMANTWPTGMPVLEDGTLKFAALVEEMSGGRLKIRVDSSNKHKAPFGIFDMVRTGQYELGHSASYYWKGKDPATPVLTTIPFGMNALEQYAWFYYGGGMELMQKVYDKHGMYSFNGGNTGVQMGGWLNKEINTVADLQGLKMRIPGLAGDVLARVGASPVNIPGGELYTALERGTIDALEWVNPAIDIKMGFQQIAKYYYTGWHEPAAELQYLVNKKAFDSLPADLQAIVRSAMRVAALDTLVHGIHASGETLIDMQEKFPNLEIRSFPPAVMEKLKQATQEVLDELAASNAEAREIIESQRAYKKQVGAWTDISTLRYLQTR